MLRGTKVGLRAIEPEDLETLRSWRNQSGLRRFFREFREIAVRDQLAWYESLRTDLSVRLFAMELNETKGLLGAAGFSRIDWLRRSAEVSLYLGETYVDDELAPDALSVLREYGFRSIGLHRLWAEVYEFDVAKATLFLDAGFKHEGTLREAHFDGGWHDSLVYGLLVDEH